MRVIMRTTGDRDVSEYYKDIPDLILSMIEERSAYKNFQNALMLAGDDSSLHLEDDIILCNDFMVNINSIINAHKNEVVQFFTGVRKDDIDIGTRYVNGSDFLWAQCFYLPATLSRDILEFSNAYALKEDKSAPLDSMVGEYMKLKKMKYLRICPGFVDHKEGQSLINSKRNQCRISDNFIKAQNFDRLVKVKCVGSDLIDYKLLHPLQGKLKIRTKVQLEKLIRSIIEQGFSYPFFAWKDKKEIYILDGHGRINALKELESYGYIINNAGELIVRDTVGWVIPPLPVIFVEAEDKIDAKVKLLRVNSIYGNISQNGLKLIQEGLNIREISGLEIKTYDAPIEFFPTRIETNIDIDISRLDLNPDISMSVVTEDAIKVAEEENSSRKALEIETISLTCKCCGHNFEVRKSDMAIKINQTLYEV